MLSRHVHQFSDSLSTSKSTTKNLAGHIFNTTQIALMRQLKFNLYYQHISSPAVNFFRCI